MNKLIQPPAKKSRGELRFNDLLWKAILMDLLLDFLEMCHPKLYKLADKTKPIEFYDKEFPRLHSSGRGKNRRADLIAKVHLLTGELVSIIVHVEAQGYTDPTFSYRMEVYNYRAHDRHQLPVESIALLVDNDPKFRPSEYCQKVVITERRLKFLSIKLMDYKPEKLRKSGKLFAIVLEAAWYGLKANKLNDAGLMSVKMDLLRRLAKRQIPREKIVALMSFIQTIVRFDKPGNTAIFGAELDKLDKKIDMEPIIATANPPIPWSFSALLHMKEQELKEAVKNERRRVQHEMKKLIEAERLKADAERLKLGQEAEAERQNAEAERLKLEQKAEAERQNAEAERLKLEQKAEAERQEAEAEKIKTIKFLLSTTLAVEDICKATGTTEDFVRSFLEEK